MVQSRQKKQELGSAHEPEHDDLFTLSKFKNIKPKRGNTQPRKLNNHYVSKSTNNKNRAVLEAQIYDEENFHSIEDIIRSNEHRMH